MAKWYVRRGTKEQGPIGKADLMRFAEAGKIMPSDELKKDGEEIWFRAGDADWLFPAVATTPVKPVAPRRRFSIRWLALAVIIVMLAGTATWYFWPLEQSKPPRAALPRESSKSEYTEVDPDELLQEYWKGNDIPVSSATLPLWFLLFDASVYLFLRNLHQL